MNQLKTLILFATLTALFMWVGNELGGQMGMISGLLMAGVGNFIGYFFSDRMVLWQYNAKPVSQDEAPKLYRMVTSLAQRANLPMPKVYMIEMAAPNAFATGRDPAHAAIAVSPSIMQMMNEEELEGILAHELGHVKHRDILISTMAATVAGALSYLAQMAYYIRPSGRSADDRQGSPISLLFILIVTPLIATLLHLAISREREYAADIYGAKLTSNPRGLARALGKLGGFVQRHPVSGSPAQESSAHLFIINPFTRSMMQSLFSTHPPLVERIRRLEQMT